MKRVLLLLSSLVLGACASSPGAPPASPGESVEATPEPSIVVTEAMGSPHLGDVAPDFELPDQDGRAIKLSDFRGQRVVVYFYPKAATPGCTTQACGVRDHRADYEQANAVVLGISPDSVAKVKKFHDKEGLNFPLLADEDHAVAEAYGVWVTKSMYGRTYLGNERTTFVIDAAGTVVEVLRKVKPSEHDGLVLGALSAAAARDAGP